MNPHELPKHRLATSDSSGRRIYLYPAEVKGFFRKLRFQMNSVLILLFLALPWFRVGGHQAVLLDIVHGRFAIFGLTFWAHDAPLLVFVFGGAAIGLAWITSILGRVWCGWACPQTVFVDGVFRVVERWIEGNSLDRRRLDTASFSFSKLLKKSSKWFVFALLAMLISHSFLAYFVGTESLADMMLRSPLENPKSFLIVVFITAMILFDFGWFREQFCTLVCPYGRFQSVMMDEQSLVVAYDQDRGDCVNCYRCVQVCPTGVDIRRGVQLECIACTACIDACDEVMTRIKKPSRLIRYRMGSRWLRRGRVWIYGTVLVIFMVGLVTTVMRRTPIEMVLIRAVDSPYQVVSSADGATQIINHFKVDLRNQTFDEHAVSFEVHPDDLNRGIELILSNQSARALPGGASERIDLFIRFPKQLLHSGHGAMKIRVAGLDQEVRLVGPLL